MRNIGLKILAFLVLAVCATLILAAIGALGYMIIDLMWMVAKAFWKDTGWVGVMVIGGVGLFVIIMTFGLDIYDWAMDILTK